MRESLGVPLLYKNATCEATPPPGAQQGAHVRRWLAYLRQCPKSSRPDIHTPLSRCGLCLSYTLDFSSLRPVKIKGVTEARACTALQHLPPPLPRQVAYVGWYTWLIRTPANLSVTLRSSNARSQCSETCQFRVRTPDFGSQVANFFFLVRRRRVAPVARHHGIGLVILTPARPSVALGSSIGVIISISAP